MGYPFMLWFSTVITLIGSFQYGPFCQGWVSCGYHLGILNTSLIHIAKELGFSEVGVGAVITCVLLIGATFGSLFAGGIADKYGPKTALFLCSIPMAIGSVLCALPANASQVWILLLGRVVAGVGVGAVSVYAPRYLAETAADDIRGALGTMNQVTMNVGIMCAYIIGLPYAYGVEVVTVDLSALAAVGLPDLTFTVFWWRVMLAAAVIPALVQAFGILLCPESPVWLDWKGFHDEAYESLRRLHGDELAAAEWEILSGIDTGAEEPLLEMMESHASGLVRELSGLEVMSRTGFRAVFDPQYRLVLVLAAGLQAMQQLSGINTLVFYSSKIFASMENPIMGSIAVGAMNSTMTVLSGLLVDRAGRKPLMLISCSGMAVALSAMSGLPLLGLPASSAAALMFGVILVYVTFFALGAGPIPRLYGAEVIPPEIKGHMQALTTSVNWVVTLLVGLTFPGMIQSFGVAGAYLFYAFLNVCGVIFVANLMVETKKRSLVEIRSLLVKDQ